MSRGWGRVDAPEEFKEEILGILEAIRKRVAETSDDDVEDVVAEGDSCD
jgi:hypothetical protein